LGKIAEKNANSISKMMQGEEWSPEGEARGLISKAGLKHTSLSTGDVLVIGGKMYMADSFGWEKL